MNDSIRSPSRATTEELRTEWPRAIWSRIALAALVAAAILLATSIGGSPGQAATGGISATSGDRYDRLWRELPRRQKRWARRTSECESGSRAKIHGGTGTYHGAFQFMLSTWRRAPKSPGGDPHKRRWRVQAVVAVYLKKRDGARTHWPNCG